MVARRVANSVRVSVRWGATPKLWRVNIPT